MKFLYLLNLTILFALSLRAEIKESEQIHISVTQFHKITELYITKGHLIKINSGQKSEQNLTADEYKHFAEIIYSVNWNEKLIEACYRSFIKMESEKKSKKQTRFLCLPNNDKGVQNLLQLIL